MAAVSVSDSCRAVGRLVLLGLVILSGCSEDEPSLDPATMRANLTSQATLVLQAGIDGDQKTVVRMMPPNVVKMAGGPEKSEKRATDALAQLKSEGFWAKSASTGEPSKIVVSTDGLYATIPTELEMQGPGGSVGKMPSYMIGYSANGGRNWFFIDGNGIKGKRSTLKSVLPNFPDSLALPTPAPGMWSPPPGVFQSMGKAILDRLKSPRD